MRRMWGGILAGEHAPARALVALRKVPMAQEQQALEAILLIAKHIAASVA